MLLTYIVFLCLIKSSLSTDLFIYSSFTELREFYHGTGAYSSEFTKTDYENIIEGSMSWTGTPLLKQEVYNTVQSLKNAKVNVRRSTICGCDTIEAKIIDPDSMLLQNLNTGAYFYADKSSIEYISAQPNESGMTLALQFQGDNTEYNGTLSYLVKGITWKPTYDLLLTGDNNYKLLAYANIKNDQQREYTVDMTHLLGGDVQLATGLSDQSHALEFDKRPMNMKPIHMDGEQRGVYSYSLANKYTLRPSSSIRLPFIDIVANYQFYYRALAGVSTGIYQGIFERNYDITPNQFMPAGIITVHDNQVLVGQANLPDISENYTQTFSVGHDNDVRYLVKGNLTAKSDEKAEKSFETYEIDIKIMNLKNKQTNTQLLFQAGVQLVLLETTCKAVTVQGNQLNISTQLNQGESRQCKLSLTVRFN